MSDEDETIALLGSIEWRRVAPFLAGGDTLS